MHKLAVMKSIKSLLLKALPDELYLKIRYRKKRGKRLDLKTPKDYNEKLNWLKIHDRKEEYSAMVDKYTAKDFAANLIGQEHIIPNLGVWNHCNEIDVDSLPNQFVLKCTHNSGGVKICTDKASFDFDKAFADLEKELGINYFWKGREWQYKNIKPRIIAEKYMVDESKTELKDYKIFCFNGQPKMIEVIYGRFGKKGANLYTQDWEYMNGASVNYPSDPSHVIERPQKLEEMLEYARVLSKGIPHVRVDFYITEDTVLFGEMTFYHSDGFGGFTPGDFNRMLGDWIDISNI